MNEWPIHPFSVIANEQKLALPGNGIIYHATQYVQNTIHSLITSLLSVFRCVSVFILTYYGLVCHFREKYIFMNSLIHTDNCIFRELQTRARIMQHNYLLFLIMVLSVPFNHQVLFRAPSSEVLPVSLVLPQKPQCILSCLNASFVGL